MAGLYIHIPFCHSKCSYCDFFSTPRLDNVEKYINALISELKIRGPQFHNTFSTIYIGGGTPSILPIHLLERLIISINTIIKPYNIIEFTIEANPEDITAHWVKTVKNFGINRVSLGIQSFNNIELKYINRRHSAETALNAINVLRENGINNISGDLIFGLPKQDLNSWKYSLNCMLNLRLPHFSAYLLSYEKGTGLYTQLISGKIEEATEDLVTQMYFYLISQAKRYGYEHYEISNFAQPGFQAIHNSNYWKGLPYLGLGVSAHSFDGKARCFNPSNLKNYITELSKGNCIHVIEDETAEELHNDYIIVALRTSQGINLETYKSKFGTATLNELIKLSEPHINNGDMQLTQTHLSITEKAMLISDRIMLDFIK